MKELLSILALLLFMILPLLAIFEVPTTILNHVVYSKLYFLLWIISTSRTLYEFQS